MVREAICPRRLAKPDAGLAYIRLASAIEILAVVLTKMSMNGHNREPCWQPRAYTP